MIGKMTMIIWTSQEIAEYLVCSDHRCISFVNMVPINQHIITMTLASRGRIQQHCSPSVLGSWQLYTAAGAILVMYVQSSM